MRHVPKRVCVDTHALIWHLSKPAKLGRRAKRVFGAVEAGTTEALIPAMVLVELSLLRAAGRRVIPAREVAELFGRTSFRLLPMDLEQTLEFAGLEAIRDPFDRLIVCAARCARAPLVCADASIQDLGVVDTIWD